MSEYADVKTRKFINALTWLKTHKPVEIKKAGKHNLKATCIHNGKAFALPTSHRKVKKPIIEKFAKWLAQNEICAEEEFRDRL